MKTVAGTDRLEELGERIEQLSTQVATLRMDVYAHAAELGKNKTSNPFLHNKQARIIGHALKELVHADESLVGAAATLKHGLGTLRQEINHG